MTALAELPLVERLQLAAPEELAILAAAILEGRPFEGPEITAAIESLLSITQAGAPLKGAARAAALAQLFTALASLGGPRIDGTP